MPKKNALDGEGADVEPQKEGRGRGKSHGRSDGPVEGIDAISYEEARSRLVEIVVRLEQGSIPLEESLRLWEIGEQLARRCQDWLDGARERLAAARAAPEAEGPRGESGTGQGASADGRSAQRASDVEGSERGSGREKK
mgnify:CR=1 FL=1